MRDEANIQLVISERALETARQPSGIFIKTADRVWPPNWRAEQAAQRALTLV